MEAQEFKLGSVVENPDLVVWEIADEDLPLDVVMGYVFARALRPAIGPDGKKLEYRDFRYLSWGTDALDAHWRDGAAVVVIMNPSAREIHAIVRHGSVFRMIRLRTE